ncbi:radical SAM/SPASM domain-containing protein [Haliangium ochraceum]|uniref:Fe-S oxidoreductase-like protein n=1 Tax=Haliangium ochraceum (strain DSM 14365 / JCM 11303 / SMP-2) TaxID=502025 RepID=D0LLY7_HALO1|nr:radical SAM/SPASM domain-containing protein [Haliangium ochraceum]ACY15165.1 Fe-S oxidoreductase-like protein [Haliangium ochraceum DSM 14365]
MYYRQAKHLGWRRYHDAVAIVDDLRNRLFVLGEPASSLWEELAAPTSIDEARGFFSRRLGKQVSAAVLRRALAPLVDAGILLRADSREALERAYRVRPRGRGADVPALCNSFYEQMHPLVSRDQLLRATVELPALAGPGELDSARLGDEPPLRFEELCALFDALAEIGVVFLSLRIGPERDSISERSSNNDATAESPAAGANGAAGAGSALRPDFADIVQAARERHFAVAVDTASARLGESTLAALRDAAPGSVSLPLYGLSAKTHEYVTGRPGSFATALANIHRLRGSDIPVVLRFRVMRHNAEELVRLAEFAEARDCLYSTSDTVFTIERPAEFLRAHRLSDDQREQLWERGLLPPPSAGRCRAGTVRIRIGASGEVYPCELLRVPLGNIRRENLRDIARGSSSMRLFGEVQRTPERCGACAHQAYCPRCPGLAHHEDGDVRGHSSLACQVSEAYARSSKHRGELVELRLTR